MPEVSETLKLQKATDPNVLVETIKSFVFAVLVCSVIYLFLLTPNQVEGTSMVPAFQDGQLVITNKISEWLGSTPAGKSLGLDYERGDIVVISKPGFGKLIIKRIVGLPGDQIEVSGGKVVINGNVDQESYIPPTTITIPGTFLQEGDIKTIPAGQYIVMGDNRENSLDSRYVEIGFISRDWIQGKVIFRYWPPDAIGIIGAGQTNLN